MWFAVAAIKGVGQTFIRDESWMRELRVNGGRIWQQFQTPQAQRMIAGNPQALRAYNQAQLAIETVGNILQIVGGNPEPDEAPAQVVNAQPAIRDVEGPVLPGKLLKFCNSLHFN